MNFGILYCRNGENFFVYFASEGVLNWLKAKDIDLCGFAGKWFHVHLISPISICIGTFFCFLLLLCVLCCMCVPHHEFKNHLNKGLHAGLYWFCTYSMATCSLWCKLWYVGFYAVTECYCTVRIRHVVLLPCTYWRLQVFLQALARRI